MFSVIDTWLHSSHGPLLSTLSYYLEGNSGYSGQSFCQGKGLLYTQSRGCQTQFVYIPFVDWRSSCRLVGILQVSVSMLRSRISKIQFSSRSCSNTPWLLGGLGSLYAILCIQLSAATRFYLNLHVTRLCWLVMQLIENYYTYPRPQSLQLGVWTKNTNVIFSHVTFKVQ